MQTLAGKDRAALNDQARRAVTAFRAMQPGLSAFARALTGRPTVRVEVSTGIPRTDGDRILYRPPLALGAGHVHDRSRCDRRDPNTGLQQCLACRVEEEVYATIFHEIAHIAYGTFEKTDHDLTVMEQGAELSPFLPTIINCLEDCRIDQRMFEARRGTKAMFEAMSIAMFRDGQIGPDGKLYMWSEMELNAQVMVGLFCIGAGYDYEGWFHPDVEAALKDETLNDLATQASHAKSAQVVYDLSIKAWDQLRRLGFCKVDENDMPDTPKKEPDDDTEPDSVDSPPDDGDSSPDISDDPQVDHKDQEVNNEHTDDSSEPDRDSSDPQNNDGSEDGRDSAGAEPSVPDDEGEPSPQEGQVDETGTDSEDSEGRDQTGQEDSRESDHATPEDQSGNGSTGSGDDESGGLGEDEEPQESSEQSDESVGSGQAEDQDSGESLPAGDDGSRPGQGSGDGTGEGGLDDQSSSGGEDREDSRDQDDSHGQRDTDRPESGSGDESGGSDSAPDQAGTISDDLPQQREKDQSAGDDEPSESGQPSPTDDPSGEGELIDTGADEGQGGVQGPDASRPAMGSADDIADVLDSFAGHGDLHSLDFTEMSPEEANALDIAVVQGMYFETPSVEVMGVTIYKNGVGGEGWSGRRSRYNDNDPTAVPESILGPALLQTRRTFDDNKRSTYDKNRKSGRIHGASLAKRAPFKDERMFGKRMVPRKKSYAVLIGIDVSGSTVGVNLALAKRAAMAQAELCQRVGIDFAVYCHSSDWYANRDGTVLDIYEVKSFNDPWTDRQRDHLHRMQACSGNLDGHSVEYYRKMIERQPQTDKIILYYSDGKMPAENHEELMILQREIIYCKRHQIELMGVGIRTDSPRRHGLDTVQVDTDADLVKVISHLGKKLNSADRN